jgi:hypothetical protein
VWSQPLGYLGEGVKRRVRSLNLRSKSNNNIQPEDSNRLDNLPITPGRLSQIMFLLSQQPGNLCQTPDNLAKKPDKTTERVVQKQANIFPENCHITNKTGHLRYSQSPVYQKPSQQVETPVQLLQSPVKHQQTPGNLLVVPPLQKSSNLCQTTGSQWMTTEDLLLQKKAECGDRQSDMEW